MKKIIFVILLTALAINNLSVSAYGITGKISINAIEKSQHKKTSGKLQEVSTSSNYVASEECDKDVKDDNSVPTEFIEYTKFIGEDISILNVDTSHWNYGDFSHDLWESSFYGYKGMISVRLGWDNKTIISFYFKIDESNKLSDNDIETFDLKIKDLFGDNVEENNISYNYSGKTDCEFQLPKNSQQINVCIINWDYDNMVAFMDKKPKSSESTEDKEIVNDVKSAPTIGMTEAEVEKSTWGKPSDINKTTTKYGTSEQWVYKFGDKYRYIYIEDGIVTAIQE